ncbi:MAG: hypothetical protein JKY03_12100, partial [Aureispira sp.]|nr:hypothetical protein [Aureispira sp.]
VPFVIVFTKHDKKKSSKNKNFFQDFKKVFLEQWNEMPQSFITSSKKKTGREPILDFIEVLNGQYFDYEKTIDKDY